MVDNEKVNKRSPERLRYAVDVAHKSVNDAFKIFSLGKRPYHQLFSDVCQDINAQLDTLNLLVQPLLDAAPKYDFEDVEGNGIRSVLVVVDCALKELIDHLKYCSAKHSSFFFNGTNAAAKLTRFCSLLSRLGKILDVATLMHQQLGGKGMFLELDNPVGAVCMREIDALPRECFYGQLVAFHYTPSIRNVMKGICVALSSYGIGYYTDVPMQLGSPQSLIWRSSASIFSGARYWFKEEERARKFVELTHNCASVQFTKSFWNLVENGILAEVPKFVNRHIEIAVEIFIDGEPIYVRNKYKQMILIHPPVGKQGFAGVPVGFLSARLREGQVTPAPPLTTDAETPPATPTRFPKSRRLLVHFHGGGFVSGSHVQHEAYLRGWCSELDAVVVSINYSLAPENPFPKGLDDCIFAYAWCLENLHTLGCTGESIVFVGDSAGGNLALTTAMRANSYGLRAPDGIVAVYPVTYVKYAGSVSRLLSTMDILLPAGVLQCCLRAYSGVPVESNDMFYDWMQTADSVPAESSVENEQTISDLNSKYISDIAGSTRGSRYMLPSTPDMPSVDTPTTPNMPSVDTPTTPNMPSVDTPTTSATDPDPTTETHIEDVGTEDVVLEEEEERGKEEPSETKSKLHRLHRGDTLPSLLSDDENGCDDSADPGGDAEGSVDTIRINPGVFDQNNPVKLLAQEIKTREEKTEDQEEEHEAEDLSEGSSAEMTSSKQEDDLANSPARGTEGIEPVESETGDESKERRGNGTEGLEEESFTEEEGLEEERFTDIMKTEDVDLEKMLYDDNETKFKGAKLVLTPNKAPLKRITPATQGVVEPNPLGKMATVIREHETYNDHPEPAYIINPGEIATRKNISLMQKYFDDPFMSPYLADQETLRALPPIHIVAAELDPLLDDSVAFCKKVKAAGGTVSLEIVQGMTHGFLNLVLSSTACAAAAKRCLVAISKHYAVAEAGQTRT